MTSWLYMVTPSFARPCALSKICFVILVTLMVTLEGVEGVEDTSLGCRGCGLGVGSGGGAGQIRGATFSSGLMPFQKAGRSSVLFYSFLLFGFCSTLVSCASACTS